MPNFAVAQLPGIEVAFAKTTYINIQKSLRSSGLVALLPGSPPGRKPNTNSQKVASSQRFAY
jgi:hypothetical protein